MTETSTAYSERSGNFEYKCCSLETLRGLGILCSIGCRKLLIATWFHVWMPPELTHWGRVTHWCVSKLFIIGSDKSLSPDRRQAIIWTNDGIMLIAPLGTNFSEILIAILTFSFKKMRLKVSSTKRRPFCFGLDVLTGNNSWQKVITPIVVLISAYQKSCWGIP